MLRTLGPTLHLRVHFIPSVILIRDSEFLLHVDLICRDDHHSGSDERSLSSETDSIEVLPCLGHPLVFAIVAAIPISGCARAKGEFVSSSDLKIMSVRARCCSLL